MSQCKKGGEREDIGKEQTKKVSLQWHGSRGHGVCNSKGHGVGTANTIAKHVVGQQPKTNRALINAVLQKMLLLQLQ
eukprot:8432966-Ditylum_brightwellii.AAC.1